MYSGGRNSNFQQAYSKSLRYYPLSHTAHVIDAIHITIPIKLLHYCKKLSFHSCLRKPFRFIRPRNKWMSSSNGHFLSSVIIKLIFGFKRTTGKARHGHFLTSVRRMSCSTEHARNSHSEDYTNIF